MRMTDELERQGVMNAWHVFMTSKKSKKVPQPRFRRMPNSHLHDAVISIAGSRRLGNSLLIWNTTFINHQLLGRLSSKLLIFVVLKPDPNLRPIPTTLFFPLLYSLPKEQGHTYAGECSILSSII